VNAVGAAVPLVAFDLGGVLVRICGDMAHGCRVAGVTPRAEPVPVDPGRMRELTDAHQRGELDHADFLRGVSQCLGGSLDVDEVGRVHDAWILGEYEGVSDLLQGLRARGAATACLSNTNASHWVQLHRMAFFGGLDHRHASHELGLVKPDPRIFQAFERRIGRSGADIVYFDDLEENVQAAAHAGWQAHRVDPRIQTVPQIRAVLRAQGILA
jgi:FMN phosphatase YigB (HAD superfamily)